MRQTSNGSVGYQARSVGEVVRQISLPHEHPPGRFPSFPSLERTSVMGFANPVSLSVAANTTAKLMLARQAAYPLWGTYPQAYPISYSAAWRSTNEPAASTSDTLDFTYAGSPEEYATGGHNVVGSRVTSVAPQAGYNVVAPPGGYAIMGIDKKTGDMPWIYCSDSTAPIIEVYFVSGQSGIAASASFNYELWDGPGDFHMVVETNATMTPVGAFFLPGGMPNRWIRPHSVQVTTNAGHTATAMEVSITMLSGSNFALTSRAGGGGLITVSSNATYLPAGFYPLTGPGEFGNSAIPWLSTKVTAAALSVTNVSQVLNKGGVINAGRVQPDLSDPFRVRVDYINTLHPAEKSQLSLEKGMYSYCPPSSDMQDFYNYTVSDADTAINNALLYPAYRLDNSAFVNCIFMSVGAVAEAFALMVDWHLEFRNNSALFQIGVCTMGIETMHQAQIMLARTGYFFGEANPQTVLRVLSKGNTKRRKNKGKKDIQVPSKPKPVMKPTTGQASGIASSGGSKKAKPKR